MDCATAAFMKRNWLIADVMATVPTPAHAARRIKSRREMLEKSFWLFFLILFLNDVVRRTRDQMDDRAHTVAHLRLVRRRTVRKIRAIGDKADDVRLREGGQFPARQIRIQRAH